MLGKMFATLKNKIKEETGSEVSSSSSIAAPQRVLQSQKSRSSLSSTVSLNGDEPELSPNLEQLRQQCQQLTSKVTELQQKKEELEKTNLSLLESLKLAKMQNEYFTEEQIKIQDLQQEEIHKLKSLLSFREQEALDRIVLLRHNELQLEHLTEELERVKKFESMVEDLQDELEGVQHASQLCKNNSATKLAALEEENRHLKMRLEIMEEARLETLNALTADEKLQALITERKMLEQRLEEAHLQLSDIKSTWSAQNLALETQLNRLSKQVAEETTEKRNVLEESEELKQKVKSLDIELIKLQAEVKQRDDKIKLLSNEVEDLQDTIKNYRDESEQQLIFERSKSEQLECELRALEARFKRLENSSQSEMQKLNEVNAQLHKQLTEALNIVESEKEEKLTALLRNAEISQSEERLKQELRMERNDANELHDKNCTLRAALEVQQQEKLTAQTALQEVKILNAQYKDELNEQHLIKNELNEKNATIKILNQRLADFKKTLQKEFNKVNVSEQLNGHSLVERVTPLSHCSSCGERLLQHGGLIMDEVNLKYLKHVILKFLTCREVESRQLVRAVATLLKLSKEEEKLLLDTLNWKMSWFGSKPAANIRVQQAFSMPPS